MSSIQKPGHIDDYIDDDKSVIEPAKTMSKAINGLEYHINSPSMYQPVKLMSDEQYAEYVRGLETELRVLKQQEPMTVERAVEILNQRKHLGSADWKISEYENGCYTDKDLIAAFTAFEAIAVAEKYLREAK